MPYGSTLHIPPTNLLLLAAKQKPYEKSLTLNEKYRSIFWKKLRRMDQQEEEEKDRNSNRIRQKNKRVASKVKSNDSPEIPDGGGGGRHQASPAFLRGAG